MTHISSKLPLNYIIRPLQPTDLDLLSLYIMPTNPRQLPSWMSVKKALIISKIGQGIVLAVFPSVLLYFSILFVSTFNLSIPWVWVWVGWFMILGVCIRFALTSRNDKLKFCWIVELNGCFVAYALLQPYGNYSILEALWVHSKWQRKRIGSALLKTLIQNVQKPIYVQSAVNATGFYTGLGFQKIRLKDMPSDVKKRFSFPFGNVLMIFDL